MKRAKIDRTNKNVLFPSIFQQQKSQKKEKIFSKKFLCFLFFFFLFFVEMNKKNNSRLLGVILPKIRGLLGEICF